MRLAALVLALIACTACSASPTTLTVRVDVPTGQPIGANYIAVNLSGYGADAGQLLYGLAIDDIDDAGNYVAPFVIDAQGRTLVAILPPPALGRTLQVDVEAQLQQLDPDGGLPTYPYPAVASGSASIAIVAHRNNAVTVHLTVGGPCRPDTSGSTAICDDGGAADTSDEAGMDTGETLSDASVDARGSGDSGDAAPPTDLTSSDVDAACGQTTCGSACVDLMTSDGNCGACGYACVNGRKCDQGRCTPAWLPMTVAGQPTQKGGTASAGIVGKLLVTGGPCDSGPSVTTSSLYDSATNAWTVTAPMNSPRAQHLMVSSGAKVYAFGGLTNCLNGSTIGPGLEEFDPTAKTWTPINAPNGAAPRYAFGMTWTGEEVFLYGGSGGESSGGRYNASAGTWRDASCALSGCARDNEFLFAEQGFVHLWGGSMGDAPAGKQFDLANGTWSAWTVPAVQLPGKSPDDGKRIFVVTSSATGCAGTTTVAVYDRTTGQLLSTDTPTAPDSVINASAIVWSGSEVIAWSGGCGVNPASGGGRYQPPAP